MKKFLLNIKKNYIDIHIILNILYILIASFLATIKIINMQYFSYGLIALAVLNIILAIPLSLKKYNFHKVDIAIVLIFFFSMISIFFAYKPIIAIFGENGRYEGFLTIVYYLSVFYLSTYSKHKTIIIYSILFTGFSQFLYCYCQYFHLFGIGPMISFKNKWITGLVTNPNFLGIYMLLCLCYSIGLYIENKSKLNTIIYLILSLLFMSGLLLSNTLSCLVALLGVLVILLWYSATNKKMKKYIVIVVFLLSVFSVMHVTKMTSLFKDFSLTTKEVSKISKGEVKDNFGNDRFHIWQNAIVEIPKYFWHGIGLDNFAYIKDGNAIRKRYGRIVFLYDKAHNEYLQMLLTGGIFYLLSYLILHTIVLVNGFRTSFKKKEIYLLLPIIGYLIQAMFSISVIEVAPIFFITMGLVIDRDEKNQIEKNYFYKNYAKRLCDIIFSLIVLIVLLPINIIVPLLIKIIDGGKIIFKQKRTGLNGKVFSIYKYKTMKKDKITKLGKILRVTSIDEIPQFVNVLKGDMSIIGPRPWIVDYYNNFNEYQIQRNNIRPGIVGLAQVNGRNNLSIFDKINYDIYYVNNIGIFLDLSIILNTIKVIFIKDDVKDMNKYIKNEIKDLKDGDDLSLEVLLSIKKLDKRRLSKMNITGDCTIINQCNVKKKEKYKNYKIYSYKEIGVSKSRNRGLKKVKDDIVLLCDDDTQYIDNYEEIILNEFRKNPYADVIIFNLESKNREIKQINENKRLHFYNCLGFASSNIAFRRKSVLDKNINFNKLFGPGGDYSHGEDTLFIVDCLKKKLKIYGVNLTIASVENKESTWFSGYDKKYFFDKGALFTEISRRFRHLLILQYLVRHNDVLDNMKFKDAYKHMIDGSNEYVSKVLKINYKEERKHNIFTLLTYFNVLFTFLILDIGLRKLLWKKIAFFTPSIIPPLAFSLSFILIIILLMKLFSKKAKYIYLVSTIVFNLYFLSQMIFFKIFTDFFSIVSIFSAGDGKDYLDYAMNQIDSNTIIIMVLSMIPLMISFIVEKATKSNNFEIKNKKIFFPLIILLFIILRFIGIQNLGETVPKGRWDAWDIPKNVYMDYGNKSRSMIVSGMYEYMFRDSYLYLRNYLSTNKKEQIKEVNKYIDPLDIKKEDNDYTNIFKDKNIIMIMLESIDSWIVNEDTMPTLTHLEESGLNFTNRYAPVFGGAMTINSEFSSVSGIYSISNEKAIYNYTNNDFSYSLPSLLKKNGYIVNSMHMNNGSFYNRSAFHKALGYANHYALRDMKIPNVYYDTTLVNNDKSYNLIVNKDKFFTFITTYSAHVPYKRNYMCYDLVKKYPNLKTDDEEISCINLLAHETDDFLKILMKRLEEDNYLDNTVLVVFADHYTYGYEKTLEVKKVEDKNLVQNVPLVIWSKDIESKNVDTLLDTADIAPTLLNMLGIDYNPKLYMGTDVFSSYHEPFVYFSDYSWYDGKNYSKNSNKTKYVETTSKKVKKKIDINQNIITSNYYKYYKEKE